MQYWYLQSIGLCQKPNEAQVYSIFSFISIEGNMQIQVSSSYRIGQDTCISIPDLVLQGMCNEDDNSSEIFLTFAPLKANDQDMSLRSSDQNIMKIPTDEFQGIQYNFCIFYISFISFHRTEKTTSLLHTQHNTIYGKRWK